MTNGRTRDAVGRIDIVSCGTGFPSDTAILALLEGADAVYGSRSLMALCPVPVKSTRTIGSGVRKAADEAFALARGIPLVRTTHQQGHAAAALFAAKGEEFFREKTLLFHISGGTTDLLLCQGAERITPLGTSSDLYAGQAVDRLGVKLGFPFPAGAEVSRLAALCEEPIRPKSSVKGMTCSLSGLENQCNALLQAGKSPEYVCKYCLLCVADTVVRMTKAAQKEYPGLPVVCAGGVMSSDIIRVWVQQRLPQVYFVPGLYSSDNAIGVSILAAREAGLWLK